MKSKFVLSQTILFHILFLYAAYIISGINKIMYEILAAKQAPGLREEDKEEGVCYLHHSKGFILIIRLGCLAYRARASTGRMEMAQREEVHRQSNPNAHERDKGLFSRAQK